MKSLVHAEELCSRSVPLEHAPGANPPCVSALRPRCSVCSSFIQIFSVAPGAAIGLCEGRGWLTQAKEVFVLHYIALI